MALLPSQCVVLLDVGHGNCALVRDQDNHVVIDTGPGSSLLEFLAEQRITKIDAVLISTVRDVRISCTQLSRSCAAHLPRTDPNHLMALFAKGRAARLCCGGTLLIDLSMSPDLQPDNTRHQVFIATYAPTALCMIRSQPEV